MSGRLDGAVALVTGASRGQGAAHARRLAQDGASVLLTDILDAEGEAHAAALSADGHDVAYLHLDVASQDGWDGAVTAAEHAWGRLDVLVNNAGIVRVMSLVDETQSGWQSVMDVNALGVFLGIRAAVPTMRRGGGGSIINTTSIYGPVGAARYAAYAASKGAVLALTKVAALEHARDAIRVNAVCPGPVATPMSAEEGDASVDVTPMQRRAEPQEIAATVSFLASRDSSFMTGSELVVDGGYLAR